MVLSGQKKGHDRLLPSVYHDGFMVERVGIKRNTPPLFFIGATLLGTSAPDGFL
jgi:hypothetical protein